MKFISNWWNEFFKNCRVIFKIQSQSSEVQCGCFSILKYMTDFFFFFHVLRPLVCLVGYDVETIIPDLPKYWGELTFKTELNFPMSS